MNNWPAPSVTRQIAPNLLRIRSSENLLPQPLQNQHLQKRASRQDASPEEHRDEGSLFAHAYRQPSNTAAQPLQNQHLQKCIKTKNFNSLWNQHLQKTWGEGVITVNFVPDQGTNPEERSDEGPLFASDSPLATSAPAMSLFLCPLRLMGAAQ
jgi:hypothetical protein